MGINKGYYRKAKGGFMETVKNLQKWKIENGLFGRADICYGYSTKDFDEYIKANNVPCVLVKQETSGQICRFYEKEQKEIIVAYLKEKERRKAKIVLMLKQSDI